MKEKHLIVISADALVYEDLEFAKTLPMFGMLMEKGSRINKVRTIYPTLTHPIHVAMMTGCAAGKNGVPANTEFHPGNLECPWYNHLDQVRAETIFHAAHRAGLKTAACRWPVTANGGDVIDYLVPEVMGLDMRGHEDDPAAVYRALGTTEELMDIVEKALSIYGCGNAHPNYDEFQMYCAAEIFRRYQPNLMMVHPGFIDGERHRTGLFTDHVKESLVVTDRWLSMIWDGVKDAGLEDETDFVVLSDHGHLNINRTVCPNVFFRDAGYIRTDEAENLVSWDAYAASCALSAQIYLSRPDDEALKNEIYGMLSEMAEEKLYGFERVFTKEEVEQRYGLSGDFSFVIETDGFTTFSDDWRRPVVRGLDTGDYRFGHSTHGHMPEKGPQPPFLAMGPSFKHGAVLEEGRIIDHAPTFAKLLGVKLPGAEGTARNELLN